jgi:signal recognition particle receptor subunit beta
LPDGSITPCAPEHEEFVRWALSRFIQEAQTLAQFKHPHIVRVVRYLKANGTAYIVMEFEEGRSLDERLRAGEAAPAESMLRAWLLTLLDGLHQVHEKSYLHRDIKPANIYVRDNGEPVLLDFGAARVEVGGEDSGVVLTPGYAPPEQYEMDALQAPCSDLYSLGATLYRCVTGERPVSADTRLRAFEQTQTDPLQPLSLRAAGRYTPALLEVIDWMMVVDMESRPQSALEVLRRLRGMSETRVGAVFSYRPSRKAQVLKVLITGPDGAGKTSAIRELSDIEPVSTEQEAHDAARVARPHTTVAMDYGLMRLTDTQVVHLYGAPGDKRFEFMWQILQRGAAGLVVLLDNRRSKPFAELEAYLDAYRELIERTAVVVGITRMDECVAPTIPDYHAHLRRTGKGWCQGIPILEVDARSRADLTLLVQALLTSIDPRVAA